MNCLDFLNSFNRPSDARGEELVCKGVATSTRLRECIRQVTLADERILHVRLEHTCEFMTFVGVCAPPEDQLLRDKEQFYHKLNLVNGRCPAQDVLVILGDFNGQTGSDRAR